MIGGIGISLVNEHGKDDHVEEMKRVAQVMMKYENVKDEGFLCSHLNEQLALRRFSPRRLRFYLRLPLQC